MQIKVQARYIVYWTQVRTISVFNWNYLQIIKSVFKDKHTGYNTYIKVPIQIKFGFQTGRLPQLRRLTCLLCFAHARMTRVTTE
jgi:hypothetical protein